MRLLPGTGTGDTAEAWVNGAFRWISAAVALFATVAVSTAIAEEPRLSVYTVNYPLEYFAGRIGGEYVDAVFPAPADVDPAFWRPDPATLAAYQQADLILLNGAGYAKWLSLVSLPRRKLVDTSASFDERYIMTEGAVAHSHGREGDHSHAGAAFTTWLDFSQAAQQAKAVRDALSRLRPEHSEAFEANHRALERDLLDLDAKLKAMIASEPNKPLVASHPVYQYLARRYSLNLKSVMWEADAMAPEAEWQALEKLLEDHPAAWFLWEGEPLVKAVSLLETIGLRSLVFNPLGNRPESGDFLAAMRKNVDNLAAAYR